MPWPHILTRDVEQYLIIAGESEYPYPTRDKAEDALVWRAIQHQPLEVRLVKRTKKGDVTLRSGGVTPKAEPDHVT